MKKLTAQDRFIKIIEKHNGAKQNVPGDMKKVFFNFFSAFSYSSDVILRILPTVGTALRNPSTLKPFNTIRGGSVMIHS